MIGAVQADYHYNWTAVRFNGTDTYLLNSTNMGIDTSGNAFCAIVACARVFLDALPGSGKMTIIGHTTGGLPQALLAITSSGAVEVQTPCNYTNLGFIGQTADGTFPIKQWVTIHLYVRQGTAGNTTTDPQPNARRVVLSMNALNTVRPGVPEWTDIIPVDQGYLIAGGWFQSPPAVANFPLPTAWSIGADTNGANKFAGRMSLVWMNAYTVDIATSDFKMTNAGEFTPIRPLGAQLQNPGARPHIGFGVTQTVANWNAGSNLGKGTGTWTMNGAVTAG
jgi:hypothetical protein